MTRNEKDSLTVYEAKSYAKDGRVELWNSTGLVGTFHNRDEAYAEIRRLRGA